MVTGKSKRRQEKAARRRLREDLERTKRLLGLRRGKSVVNEFLRLHAALASHQQTSDDLYIWFEEGDVFDNGAWRPLTQADITRPASPAAAAPPDAQSLTCAATACPAPLASDPRPWWGWPLPDASAG